MECYDENNELIPYNIWEKQEQIDANEFVKEDVVVLELGARWGGVSCVINKKLKNQENHLAVEPDQIVWESLEKNRDRHNCKFKILKGTISKKPLKIDKSDKRWNGLATFTKGTNHKNSNIIIHSIPDMSFNVLIADCEGFLETFYDENKEFFKTLRLIMFEKDRENECDYNYLIKEFNKLGFKEIKSGFHSVFRK